MTPRNKRYFLAWCLLTFLFLALRFQNLPGVFTHGGVIVNDTDPYYRFHRIETMLKEHRFYPLHDTHLNYPIGNDVPWPLGLDILIALPLQLYHSFSTFEVASFASVSIPFFSLPLLWCAGFIGTWFAGPFVGLLLGLLITCSRLLIYQTNLGRVDHHFLEAMMPVALLMFALKFKNNRERYDAFWMIGILSLTPSFAPEGWILGVFLLVALLFDHDSKPFHAYSKIFFYSFLLSLIPLSFSSRFCAGYFSWISFSWWTPWLYLTIGFLMELLHVVFNKKKDALYQMTLGLSFLVVMIFLFQRNGSYFIQDNVVHSVQTLSSSNRILGSTVEATPIFKLPFEDWRHNDFYIVLLGTLCFLFFLFQRRRLYLLGFCLVPLIFSYFQVRLVTFSLSLIFLLFLLFCHDMVTKFQFQNKTKYFIMFLITLLTIFPFRPPSHFFAVPNGNYYFEPVRAFSLFLNDHRKRFHDINPNDAVLAHWDYGHWILYYTGLPVIANPFQDSTAMEVVKLYTSPGTSGLDQYIKIHPSRYLMIESGALRSYLWLEVAGKNRDMYFEKYGEDVDNQLYRTNKEFNNLFMFRYFFELGRDLDNNHPQHWRLIYISPIASPTERDLSALKVFEHVAGATIHAHSTKIYANLYLQTDILEKGDPTVFQQKALGKYDFEWTVPYGAYEDGDVKVSGNYVIRDAGGKVIYRVPTITDADVRHGSNIDVWF